jgi:hypothetical protein
LEGPVSGYIDNTSAGIHVLVQVDENNL